MNLGYNVISVGQVSTEGGNLTPAAAAAINAIRIAKKPLFIHAIVDEETLLAPAAMNGNGIYASFIDTSGAAMAITINSEGAYTLVEK